MEKKTTKSQQESFIKCINIANHFCKEWEENLLSDEVLADRISELVKTREGLRAFFAYALSDINCALLDRLPTSILFKFRESGEEIVEITVKNLVMSSAQILQHKRTKNNEYEIISSNIAE